MASCIVFHWYGLHVGKNRQIKVLKTCINQYAIFLEMYGGIDPHLEALSRLERLLTVLIERNENKSKVTNWLFLFCFTQLSRFIFLSYLCIVIYWSLLKSYFLTLLFWKKNGYISHRGIWNEGILKSVLFYFEN